MNNNEQICMENKEENVMINKMLDYIKTHYFYNFSNDDYQRKIIDHKNYYEIILDENNICFKAVFSNQGILLYCYLTTEKLIDCMDDDNFFVMDFKGGMIENVLHFQCRNYVFWLEGSVRGLTEGNVDSSTYDGSLVYAQAKSNLLGQSDKKGHIRKRVKNN